MLFRVFFRKRWSTLLVHNFFISGNWLHCDCVALRSNLRHSEVKKLTDVRHSIWLSCEEWHYTVVYNMTKRCKQHSPSPTRCAETDTRIPSPCFLVKYFVERCFAMLIGFKVIARMQMTNVDRVDMPRSHTDHFPSDAVQYSIFRFVIE